MGKFKKLIAVVLSCVMLLAVGATVSATEASDKIKVACIGDSITAYDAYWQPMQDILGDEYEVKEFAISGVSLTTCRADYIGTQKHLDSIAYNPDVVVMMFGINDSNYGYAFSDEVGTASYKENCGILIDAYRAQNEDVKILLMSPTPQDDATTYSDSATIDRPASNARMPEAVKALSEVAAEKGCVFFDMFGKFCEVYATEVSDGEKNGNVWEDGTHLSGTAGQGTSIVIADWVATEVTKITNNKLLAGIVAPNTVSVVQDTDVTADFYIATYKDNMLNSILKIEDQALVAGTAKTLDTTGLDVEGVDYIRAYCWTDTLSPVSEYCLVGDKFVQDGTTVTITGQNPYGASREHAILIKDDEDNVVYAGQTISDNNGIYTYTFTPAEGTCTSYTILTEGKDAAIVEVVSE